MRALALLLSICEVASAATVSVSTEAEFAAAIKSGNTIELSNDISVGTPLLIGNPSTGGVVGLAINGIGHTIDGQRHSQCFNINYGSEVAFKDVIIANGFIKTFYGGGFYIAASQVTFENCKLVGNEAGGVYGGGGMFIAEQSFVNITGSEFSENTGGLYGGGLITTGGVVSMVDTNFLSNIAGYGSGMSIQAGARVTMTNCNVVDGKAAAVDTYVNGGGVFVDGSYLTMRGCNVSGNNRGGKGYGGGLALEYGATVDIHDTRIENNTATQGGGVYIFSTMFISMFGTTEAGNTAESGGGVYLPYYPARQSALEMVGCAFADNSATSSTGAKGADVDGTLAALSVFSACGKEGTFNAGSGGVLQCEGCDGREYPADLLSSADSCDACGVGTFSCCGAVACQGTAPECTAEENAICAPIAWWHARAER